MTVTLAFNERTKSHFLLSESIESKFALVLKYAIEDSANFLTASVNKLSKNSEFILKPVAKFDTAIGFLKHKDSTLQTANLSLIFRNLFDNC